MLHHCKSFFGLILIATVGFSQAQSRQSASLPSPAPDHVALMSPRCAALADVLRTAASKGIKYSTLSDARAEYNRDCQEDELQARQKFGKQRMDQRDANQASQQAKLDATQQARMSVEMCGELKRVIKNKKLRTDLTVGEKSDLGRSEQNYKARCT